MPPGARTTNYVCILALFEAGACPSGPKSTRKGVKTEEVQQLAEGLAAAGLYRNDDIAKRTFGRLQDGRPYSWTPVNKGLKGLNCDTDFVKYQHNKGWRLTQVGEDQARQYCHRDNLPLPQWAGGQGVGSTQPQRTGVGTPQQARGRSSMQASAQELRRLPASAAAAQAAMRRQVQAAAGAVAGQQPAVLATTAGGSIRPRLAGTKREGREPDVVDLYGGREGGAPPAQRARQGEPGGSGAGGSVERLGSQARELAEMLGVPQSAAEAALIASHGDRNAAAGLLLDAAQPAMAQQQQQPQGGVLRAGRRADPATEWPLRGRLALPPLEPGEQFGSTYDVVLLLDANEQQGRLPALVNALQARGVVAETRRLPVGDALWVARPRGAAGARSGGTDYVLGFVLERKSSADLAASIKDGRYAAQKWCMLRCDLPHPLYLVETDGDGSQHSEATLKGLHTARATTHVVDGMTLLYSKHSNSQHMRPNTVDWLANLTDSITRRCSSEAQRGGGGAAGAATTAGAPPPLMTLAELQARVRQVKADALGGSAQWQLMLQASGLSAAAAQAVTARYPTPAGLLRQVELFGRTDVAAQLAALPCPRGGRQPPLAADQALALLHQLFPCENVRQVEQAQRQQAQRQQAQRKQPHALQQPQPGSAVATAAGGTPAVPRFKGPKRSARAPAAFMPADRTEAAAGHHEIIDLTED